MKINYSNEPVIKKEKSIFLAGPTPNGKKIAAWRKEVIKILKKLDYDGVVYIPEYRVSKVDYNEQSLWEREALTNATVILFWVPRTFPQMPAFTTNVEFGYWLHTGKIIYGRPKEAKKTKYLDWLYKLDYNKKPYSNLENLIKDAVEMTNDLYKETQKEVLPLEERIILKDK